MPSKPPLRITRVARGAFGVEAPVSDGEVCPRGPDIARAISATAELPLSRRRRGRDPSEPAVLEGGQGAADPVLVLEAALGHRHPGTVRRLREHQTPGVYD